MSDSAPERVTRLLVRLREGNDAAAGDLFEHVYTELRRRARGQRKRWKGDPSLQTTALAHEAYLKLVGPEEQSWENRSHFFAVAAKAMRQILLNEARRKRAQKRGGEAPTLSLEALREELGRDVALTEERAEVLVVLDEALELLEDERPRAARVVECRFFGGMTIEETAEALGVSGSTVSRDWKTAKTWLYREMKRIRGEEASDEASS
jgi:RNA polymerase sigma factor (TIGR02999 family)